VLRGTEQDGKQFSCDLSIKLSDKLALRHELVPTLQALLLEQSRFDKEYENTLIGARSREVIDVPIILGPDLVSRKHKQATKNHYQTKGESYSGIMLSFIDT
jgi:hypothetical protein